MEFECLWPKSYKHIFLFGVSTPKEVSEMAHMDINVFRNGDSVPILIRILCH